MIVAERKRQIDVEGYGDDHDDDHVLGELALAAACYAAPGRIYHRKDYGSKSIEFEDPWPWDAQFDRRPSKPKKVSNKHRIRLLTKAGALIAAEIDRLLRIENEK